MPLGLGEERHHVSSLTTCALAYDWSIEQIKDGIPGCPMDHCSLPLQPKLFIPRYFVDWFACGAAFLLCILADSTQVHTWSEVSHEFVVSLQTRALQIQESTSLRRTSIIKSVV